MSVEGDWCFSVKASGTKNFNFDHKSFKPNSPCNIVLLDRNPSGQSKWMTLTKNVTMSATEFNYEVNEFKTNPFALRYWNTTLQMGFWTREIAQIRSCPTDWTSWWTLILLTNSLLSSSMWKESTRVWTWQQFTNYGNYSQILCTVINQWANIRVECNL